MKKAIFAITALGLLLITACKKNENNSTSGNAGGTWTFKSVNYQASYCDTSGGGINAFGPRTKNDSATEEVSVDFFYAAADSAGSGSYTVIKGINTITKANQVEVGVTDQYGNYYISTGNSSATVTVTLNSGKLSVSGTGIELVNLNVPTDSASLTFSIQQTD